MTTRKRKSPERKPARKAPGLLVLAGSALGGIVRRYPLTVGGASAFLIVFGFVSANAFWYQPGQHPSPFLRTRDPHNFTALLGLNRAHMTRPDPNDVTTFRIQRETAASAPEDEVAAAIAAGNSTATPQPVHASAPVPDAASLAAATVPKTQAPGQQTAHITPAAVTPAERPLPATADEKPIDPVAAAIRSAERNLVTAPQPARLSTQKTKASSPSPAAPAPPAAIAASGAMGQTGLVMDIQRGLVNIAYANVNVDGVAGDQTRAAIRHFQRHYRMAETGEPDAAVLAKLKSIGAL
ncbi:peptidoglycan-binding domain-containing protein [Allorhizobium undicola]|uniref:peptidoglycan-binding domain-containing protein n=1 Tax=Allorhizobium undicola TaxID=78527 RepID=UPI000489AD68|nr:peptidoglycan-binding domain-containing protein [Allorhizobium undicola]